MHPRGHELSPKQPLLHITASLFMRETSRIISTSSHCHRLQGAAVTPSDPVGRYKPHPRKGGSRAASDNQRSGALGEPKMRAKKQPQSAHKAAPAQEHKPTCHRELLVSAP